MADTNVTTESTVLTSTTKKYILFGIIGGVLILSGIGIFVPESRVFIGECAKSLLSFAGSFVTK